ncbi:hypothetical protein [Mycobacteroides abscessus]|uniref:hypothetical protein n=1 Tax=Mycobacteroides abscessus TaxID=36809 RepID=UPI0009C7E8CB|nr:hypothetical protein [Mycobacteroides abscessus]MDM3948260.1 hypothetical protein [Mycobacteroides abscessus]SLI38611.1 Uncharacterised protein [Mycobacteroides abscessus subsp. massiliense]
MPESQESELDIITRIDDLLSMDTMTWSPVPESEKARILAGGQGETPRPMPWGQIHAVPAPDVREWRDWWDGLSESDQADTPWYVVCFEHGVAGERSVTCGCGNPSIPNDFR